MANSLFNRFGGYIPNRQAQNNSGNILNQFAQVSRNPGIILDIMLNNGKINQQQYNDLQQFRNNPEMICKYLVNNGRANEINYAQQIASNMQQQ